MIINFPHGADCPAVCAMAAGLGGKMKRREKAKIYKKTAKKMAFDDVNIIWNALRNHNMPPWAAIAAMANTMVVMAEKDGKSFDVLVIKSLFDSIFVELGYSDQIVAMKPKDKDEVTN